MYFLTFTVIDWFDVFTRKEYCFLIVDSMNYCIWKKGLDVFAWVIMSNHIHCIWQARENYKLSDIIRDFKKFTAKQIIEKIKEGPESRSVWLLNKFRFAGERSSRNRTFKFWRDDNHAIELGPTETLLIEPPSRPRLQRGRILLSICNANKSGPLFKRFS